VIGLYTLHEKNKEQSAANIKAIEMHIMAVEATDMQHYVELSQRLDRAAADVVQVNKTRAEDVARTEEQAREVREDLRAVRTILDQNILRHGGELILDGKPKAKGNG
jgi:hypothetical protein